ncbi:hypothetical protein pb186bvf_016309 [Paramecium bursaria]
MYDHKQYCLKVLRERQIRDRQRDLRIQQEYYKLQIQEQKLKLKKYNYLQEIREQRGLQAALNLSYLLLRREDRRDEFMDTNIKVSKLIKQYEQERSDQEKYQQKEQDKILLERSRILKERQTRFSSLNPEEIRSHQKTIKNYKSANRDRVKTEMDERKKQEAEYIVLFDQKLRSKTYSNTITKDSNQKEQNLSKQEFIKELKINQNQYAEKIRTQIKHNTINEAEKLQFPQIKESVILIDNENKEILNSIAQHSNDQSMQTIGLNQTPQTLQVPRIQKNSRYFSYSENNQSISPSSMKTRMMGIENLKYMKKLPKRRQQIAQSLDYDHKINYLDEIRGKFKSKSPKSPQDMMLMARQLELKAQHAYPRSRVKGDKYLLLSIQTKLDILQM